MLKSTLTKIIATATEKAFPNSNFVITLEYPEHEDHGDFSCNVAMQLSKPLKKNPREVAETIIQHINTETNNSPSPSKHVPSKVEGEKGLGDEVLISKIEIAGPGFINFFIENKAYHNEIEQVVKEIDSETFGRGKKKNEKIIVEYSQPNIAKPLGVHHILTTIIGQSISNIFRYLQYHTTSINYIGDWGTQFGKVTHAYKVWGDRKIIEKDPINELLKLYVKFHDEAENDPTLDDKGRLEFKKLEEGDEENVKIWQWIVEISMKNMHETYEKLGGISFDHDNWGESRMKDKAKEVIQDGIERGIFKDGEEGALLCFFPNEKYPPYMIRKKDGTTLYSTRDLPTIKERDGMVGDGRIVYVVDVAQKLYFEQLFETARILGYIKKSNPVHVVFGRMSFPDGAMSTRKGKVILMSDVLDEAEKRALEKIKGHNSELPLKEQKTLAKIIGVGAVKYNVLSQSRNKNYTFDWDNMLSFEGNSAPYLQYAYTRTNSLLTKGAEEKLLPRISEISRFETKEELRLIKKIIQLPEVLEQTLSEYKTNHLCTYLFELAQLFSNFYNSVQIISKDHKDESEARLALVKIFAHVLKKGLNLLAGIEVPERM